MIMIDKRTLRFASAYQVLITITTRDGPRLSGDGDRREKREITKKKKLRKISRSFFCLILSFFFHANGRICTMTSFHDCRYLQRVVTTVTLHLYKATFERCAFVRGDTSGIGRAVTFVTGYV